MTTDDIVRLALQHFVAERTYIVRLALQHFVVEAPSIEQRTAALAELLDLTYKKGQSEGVESFGPEAGRATKTETVLPDPTYKKGQSEGGAADLAPRLRPAISIEQATKIIQAIRAMMSPQLWKIQRIAVIRLIRELTTLSLLEAKNLVYEAAFPPS
jgi:hypothetical protein